MEILDLKKIEEKSSKEYDDLIKLTGLIIIFAFLYIFVFDISFNKLFLILILIFISLYISSLIEKRYWDTKKYMFKYFVLYRKLKKK